MPYPTKKLGEVCFFQEGPGIRKHEYKTGGYPIINVRCVQDGFIDLSNSQAVDPKFVKEKWSHFQVEEGDILFTTSGTIGRVAIAKKENLPLLMNTSVVRFRPLNTKELDSDYLYWQLRSPQFIKELKSYSTGSAQQNVGPTHLKRMSINVPPIAEQKKIVARLEKLLGKIKEAKRLRAEAQSASAGLLPAELHKIFEEGKKWEEKELERVCKFNMGQSPASSTYNTSGVGLPFYQGKKDYGEKYPAPRVWCSDPIKIVEAGDILISVRAPVGALNIAKEKSCIGRGLAGLRSEVNLDQGFLFHFLKLRQKDISDMGTGSTFTAISKKHLEKLKISLPPIAEQKRIVARLDSLSEKISILRQAQDKTASDFITLEQAILSKAFSI